MMINTNSLSLDSSILYRCNQKYYDRILQEYGIGYTQFVLLMEIYENDGTSMNELAQIGSFDKGTITKSLQKLEQLGYVKIEASPFDKRSKLLHTTEMTRSLMPRFYQLKQEWYNYLTSDLSEEEKESYDSVMLKLVSRAREYSSTSPAEQELRFYDLRKLTLEEYPGQVACGLSVGGCNFRCPFCPNRSMVFLKTSEGSCGYEEVLELLNKRKNVLDGISISGGEPLLQNGLENFLREVKKLDLKVRIATNGSDSKHLQELIDLKLVDFVSLAVMNEETLYAQTIGLDVYDVSEVRRSIALLLKDDVDYELRMTLTRQYHSQTDIRKLGRMIRGAKTLRLISFKNNGQNIDEGLSPLDDDEFAEFVRQIRPFVKCVVEEK